MSLAPAFKASYKAEFTSLTTGLPSSLMDQQGNILLLDIPAFRIRIEQCIVHCPYKVFLLRQISRQVGMMHQTP